MNTDTQLVTCFSCNQSTNLQLRHDENAPCSPCFSKALVDLDDLIHTPVNIKIVPDKELESLLDEMDAEQYKGKL